MTAATFVPGDQDVRDALRDDITENMCVEAGAGTGKTTVLVDRIAQIVASGHAPIDRIAVITFTEKAAAELSARVREAMESARDESPEGAVRERLETALRDLNRAHIETIHAFAASLLRERPIEAGLDPGFEVLVDVAGQLHFEEAYDEWLTAEMANEPPPAALVDALNLNLEFKRVREAAERLNEQRDLLPLPAYSQPPLDLKAAVSEIGERIDAVRSLAPKPGFEHDNAYVALGEAFPLHAELVMLLDHPDALRRELITASLTKYGRGSKQSNWQTANDCRDVKRALDRVNAIMEECRNHLRRGATAALLRWLERFVKFYDAKRRADGKADFQDLLIWSRDLVRENREVRRYFQQKFDCMLVDEFQDTDPLQVELILYLCEDGQTADDWRNVRLRPGSLFIVGDPKQSIYRFRRADIGMYDAVKRGVFGGVVREITQNFRSVEPIIDWANATFGPLFVETADVQPRYIDLEPKPMAAPADDAVVIIRGVAAGTAPADVRRAEAEALASLIGDAVKNENWRVPDRDGVERTARYGDVAVLIPSRTGLQIYEEAFLRAGVPYRHEGGRAFFLRQEVRELVAVLRAIDDPSDNVASVSALRSSAFGCSDEDLLLYRAIPARFDYLRVQDSATGVVADGLRSLREFALMRHDTSLPDLVRAVLDRTRLVEFAMLQPQGEQLAANLLKIIDLSREFADASGGGLRGFVRWLKENIARTSDETDASISEETDDVVRIITIHAAKGLEFPIVAFANMNTELRDDTRVVADRSGAGHLHIRLGKKDDHFETPGFEDVAVQEQAHSDAEDLRKLYVAGTRARDRLILPFITLAPGGKKAPPCLNDSLREGGADTIGVLVDAASLPSLAPDTPVWRRAPEEPREPDVQRLIEEREGWAAEHRARVDTASAPLHVVTATSLKPEWERAGSSDADVRRGRAADFGSAVHALLERIILSQPEQVAAMSHAIAAEFGVQERVEDIERVAKNALASDVIARALRAKRVLREVPFIAAVEGNGGLAEGRIDLLFEEDGETIIVDFKTDALSAAEVASRAEHYRRQALVYAWAAHRTAGMPVREVVFLFAAVPQEWTTQCDAEFMAEAEALLRDRRLELSA